MIDMHTHILPGIDDGAKTMEQTLELARAAAAEGIETMVATPHHQNGVYVNEWSAVAAHVQQVNERLQAEGIPLTILPGQEVRLYSDLLPHYHAGLVGTLNDTKKYILLEFPSHHVPRYAERTVYELGMAGLIPIIAHPERNTEILERPELLYNLVNKGALAQLTAGSLTGRFGKKVKKLSLQLIEHDLVHVLASDVHSLRGRSFYMREANEILAKEFGSELPQELQAAARAIVEGQSVYKRSPELPRRRKIFGLF